MIKLLKHLKNPSLYPIITALGLGTIIILFIPTLFHKYSIEIVDHQNIYNNQVYYSDLNSDGNSERISLKTVNKQYSYVNFYNKQNALSHVWNIRGAIQENIDIVIDDFDNNSYKEIYLFSTINDSLFINYYEYNESGTGNRVSHFITKISRRYNSPDFGVSTAKKLYDINEDNFKELFFSVYGKFSLHPRKLYSYDIKNNTIQTSKDNGIILEGLKTLKTPNGLIITGNSHATNYYIKNNKTEYKGDKGWLMVFNKELKFQFPPISFNSKDANIQTEFIHLDNTDLIIAHISYDFGLKDQKIITYNLKGRVIWERINHDKNIKWKKLLNTTSNINTDMFLIRKDNIIERLSPDLLTLKTYEVNNTKKSSFYSINFTNKNQNEIIQWNPASHTLTIHNNNFSNNISISLPKLLNNKITISKINNSKNNLCTIKDFNHWYLIKYSFNSFYPFKYFVYGLIYFLIFLILYLIQKIYIIRDLKKEQIIARLRVSSLKNQMDPHFTLNALNAVGSSILKD
ncbi:MAG: hypothetical protein U9R32_10135, partial [Bacteroidota bacterium]|nr:hypothetical protein [Bacteroidota bacterium]